MIFDWTKPRNNVQALQGFKFTLARDMHTRIFSALFWLSRVNLVVPITRCLDLIVSLLAHGTRALTVFPSHFYAGEL